jgi:hypothetical protein
MDPRDQGSFTFKKESISEYLFNLVEGGSSAKVVSWLRKRVVSLWRIKPEFSFDDRFDSHPFSLGQEDTVLILRSLETAVRGLRD